MSILREPGGSACISLFHRITFAIERPRNPRWCELNRGTTPHAMRRFLPAKFGSREWLLTSLAVLMAVVSGWLTWAAGMGAGGAWMLFTIVGTVLFVAVAGADRCFFTALFTSLLTGGLVLSMVVHRIFIMHEGLDHEAGFMFSLVFMAFVGIPVAFAWLVTFFAGFTGRDS